MEFIKSLFPSPVKKEWTRNDIYKALHGNGNIIERARVNRESLIYEARMRIIAVRNLAQEKGFSRDLINALEMEGERNRDEVSEPTKVRARFAFYNFGEHPTNPVPDFHVLESNHPALIAHGNYSLDDFQRMGITPPKFPTYDKWVKQGRPIFRG
jgi:hypothetical protein